MSPCINLDITLERLERLGQCCRSCSRPTVEYQERKQWDVRMHRLVSPKSVGEWSLVRQF